MNTRHFVSPYRRAFQRCAALILLAALALAGRGAHAQNASWAGGSGDPNEWDFDGNWVPTTTPTGIATFGSSGLTSVTNQVGAVSIGEVNFIPGAQAYMIGFLAPFTVNGAGVINNSANTQAFFIGNTTMLFSNASSAGSGTGAGTITYDNEGGGSISFSNTSTAGDAIITTGSNSVVAFSGSSTGGTAQFITNATGTFDISGLSSGSMTAGSIAGAGSYNLGSNTLIVGSTGLSGSVSGTISGAGGALVQAGSGTLTLSGSNNYSGGTTLQAGTLFVDSNNALGTGTLTIDAGTTLTTHVPPTPTGLTISNNVVVAGNFFIASGSGGGDGIKLAGNVDLSSGTQTITNTIFFGATFLSGTISNGGVDFESTKGLAVFWEEGSAANTYTGLTTVGNNVTLLLSRSGTNTTAPGDILINPGGVVLVNDNEQIADTATVTVNSAGNSTSFGNVGGFWLDGNNETIGALSGTGNVQLNDGNLDGSSSTRAGTLTVGSGTFTGAITDGNQVGTLVKTGPGTLVLGGTGSSLVLTNVNGGLLQVDGTFNAITTTVIAGGTLGGVGQLFDVNNNGGKVTPGDAIAPGTLTLSGDFGQTSAGTLTIRVGGLAAGQHDLIAAGGEAFLGGTLQLVRLNNFSLKAGDKIVIITTGFGVFGKFSTVESDTLLSAKVVYDPQDVALEFANSSFVVPGLTPNQSAVARALDIAASGKGAGAPYVTFLQNEPLGNLPHDYDLVAPEELTALFQIGEAFADVQSSNIENHLAGVRASSDPTRGGLFAGLLASDGKDGKDEKGPAAEPEDIGGAPRWNVWSEGSGDFVRVDGDANAAGYHFTTGGVTLGADYRVCDHFVVGLMGGYANTGATLTQNGSVDVESGRLGIYSTMFDKGFYLNTLATGGYNSYDTHRAALGGVAQGNTSGAEFDGLIGGGYDIHQGHFTLGPVASAQYTRVGLDSFTENGSLAPLNFNSQSQDSLRSKVGFRVSYDDVMPTGVVITPSLTAAWQHEFLDSAFALDSSFAGGAGNIFTVHGPALGRDAAIVSAGVNVQWSRRLSTYLYYYGELGRKNYEQSSVTGGVSIGF